MKIRGFRRRSIISAYISLAAIGLLGAFAAIGCGTASNTYSPTLAGSKVAVPDFSIAVTPASVSVVPGATAQYTVNLTSINGFASNVALTASGLPSGASATFGALTATDTGATATLAISTTPPNEASAPKVGGTSGKISRSTPLGSTIFTVSGTGGGKTHSTTATLVVAQAPDFSIEVTPATVIVPQGTTANYTVTLTSISGFDVSTVTLAAPTGLPANTDATYGARTVTATGATIPLNIRTSTDNQTPAGNSGIIISASGSGITHTVTFALDVTDFTITVTPATVTVQQGSNAQFTVTVTSLNGFSSPVTLSVLGLPNGITGTFTNSTITPTSAGVSTTLTIPTSGLSQSAQTLFLDVDGKYQNAEHDAPIQLNVGFS